MSGTYIIRVDAKGLSSIICLYKRYLDLTLSPCRLCHGIQ